MTRLRLLVFAFCCFCLAPTKVFATGSDFTATPDSTNSAAKSYFQYQLKPNATQKLTLTLDNMADHARKFDLQFLPAGVSSSGQLMYTPGARLIKDSGPSLLSMIQQPQTSVTVPANSQTKVSTSLHVPNTKWAGERLGSWYVRVAGEKTDAAIQNRFAMAIPVQLTVDHVLTQKPKLTLGQPKLEQNQVIADLTNHTPRLFGHITQTTQLISPDHKTLAKQVLNDAQMAPSAIMALQLPVKKALTPGTYTLDLTLTSGSQHYHLTRKFTIAADQITDSTPPAPTSAMPWWVYALIGMMIIMFAIIIWLLKTRKKS